MRICFFGDSFVQGTGDDEALGWVGRVVANARRHGIDVTGYNLGIRRDTSADIAKRWRAEAAARLPDGTPKRLAFSFGANDCAVDESGSPRVSHRASLDNTRSILVEATMVASTVMIGPIPVLDDPATDDRVRLLSGDLRGLCTELGVPFLEVCEFVTGCAVWGDEAAAGDGTHPNRFGYAALAAHIDTWPEFRRWIGYND